jgi:type VI protein secretion system component VasK
MPLSSERIKKYRRWFGWTFVASLLVTMGLATPWAETKLFTTAELVAMVTSFTTFLGFVATTIITWRKERRESNHAATDLDKKKLELEKLREEITAKNAAAQNKRKMTKRRRGV